MYPYTDEQLRFINYDGHDSVIFSAVAGSGKALTLDSQLLTPTGWIRMGDVKVGDVLLTPQGKGTRVTEVFPQGKVPIYRISFSDRTSVKCCDQHLWSVQTKVDRDKKRSRYQVLSLREIRHSLYKKNGAKNYYLPLVNLDLSEKELPIDPYLMGALLGDGGFTGGSISFTSADTFLVDKIQNLVTPFDLKVTPNGDTGIDFRLSAAPGKRNRLKSLLVELGLFGLDSCAKKIPKPYLFGSIKQRLALLCGLLDTAGTVDNNTLVFGSSSPWLAQDVMSLVQSLGGVAYLRVKSPTYTYNGEKRQGKTAHEISICLPVELRQLALSLPRKLEVFKPKKKTYKPYRAFESVEFIGEAEAQCISVDDPSSLYVTNNYTVTHNTASVVARLLKMINDGVDPSRIICFSFTNDAVEELKSRVNNEQVRITTIHSYTSSQLGKMQKFKPIATFYEFAVWFKEHFKPKSYAPLKQRMEFQKLSEMLFEDGAQISSAISAYKLQTEDGQRVPKPKLFDEYRQFLRDEKKRDFNDLLIECEKLSKSPQYKHFFEGTYDYVFVDEYQDTSTLQLKTLLSVKAKQYFLIGDRFQSIYGFSGANCDAIEVLLKSQRQVTELTLTKNFRSARKIVEHANQFSRLKAVPFASHDGVVKVPLIGESTLWAMMNDGAPCTVLVRTNNVIKEMEKYCLRQRFPMRYFNFITSSDIENIKAGKLSTSLKNRLSEVVGYHSCSVQTPQKLLDFIEKNKTSDVFITSIHKSKGREYPRVVVVNSFDPLQLENTPELIEDYSFINDKGDIDAEAMNIHYVACTRPKEEIYFLMYDA